MRSAIAFPSISTGVYGYPADAAAAIALRTVREVTVAPGSPRELIFCCFSEADRARYGALLASS